MEAEAITRVCHMISILLRLRYRARVRRYLDMQPLQMNLRVGLACCASTRHFESCTLSVGSGKAEMVHQYFSNPYPSTAVLVEVNRI